MNVLKNRGAKLLALAAGAGLALGGVTAVQSAPSANAATAPTAAATATVASTCKTAQTAYGKAVKNATKAQKAASAAMKKAKKARGVNRYNKKTKTKFTGSKSHRKLITNVNSALKRSKVKSLRISTTCGSVAQANKIAAVATNVTANTKKLTAATAKLTRAVSLFSPVRGTIVRTGKVTTKVLGNGFVYKSWPAKKWGCSIISTYSSRTNSGSTYLNCRWFNTIDSNDTAVYQCWNKDGGGTVTFRPSKGWTLESAKKAAPKYCAK